MTHQRPLTLERTARRFGSRNAVLYLFGGPARVFVLARDGKWYLQPPVQMSADGVGLAAAVLGSTGHGLYHVMAIKTLDGYVPPPAGVGIDNQTEALPDGERSNVVRYVVRRKDASE